MAASGDIGFSATMNSDDFERRIARMQDELDKVRAKLKRVGEEGKKTGGHLEEAFGDRTIQKLGAMTTGALTLGGAIGALSAALQQFRKDIEAASANVGAHKEALVKLSTSSPSMADYEKGRIEINKLRTETGMNIGEAGAVLKAARASGFQRESKLLAELSELGLNPSEIAAPAEKLELAFGGRAGGIRGATNRIEAMRQYRGAKQHGQTELLSALGAAAKPWADIGGTEDELAAMLSVLVGQGIEPGKAAEDIAGVAGRLRLAVGPDGSIGGKKGVELITNLQDLDRRGFLRTREGKRIHLKEAIGKGPTARWITRFAGAELPTILKREDFIGAAAAAAEGFGLVDKLVVKKNWSAEAVAAEEAEIAKQKDLINLEGTYEGIAQKKWEAVQSRQLSQETGWAGRAYVRSKNAFYSTFSGLSGLEAALGRSGNRADRMELAAWELENMPGHMREVMPDYGAEIGERRLRYMQLRELGYTERDLAEASRGLPGWQPDVKVFDEAVRTLLEAARIQRAAAIAANGGPSFARPDEDR